jgi:hypothetical protein
MMNLQHKTEKLIRKYKIKIMQYQKSKDESFLTMVTN